jgi:4-amino-4-deoxychorismate lyase
MKVTKPIFLESIKLKNGLFQNLKYHKERINRTTKQFFGRQPTFDLSEVLSIEVPEKGLYKVRLIYSDNLHSVEILPYTFIPVESMELIETDNLNYEYKFLDRSIINNLKEKSRADDIIIVINGHITDSSMANLVFENKEGLFTPIKSLLAGVKREYLLKNNIIKTKEIMAEDLNNFTHVRLINAMIDLEDNIAIETKDIINYHTCPRKIFSKICILL